MSYLNQSWLTNGGIRIQLADAVGKASLGNMYFKKNRVRVSVFPRVPYHRSAAKILGRKCFYTRVERARVLFLCNKTISPTLAQKNVYRMFPAALPNEARAYIRHAQRNITIVRARLYPRSKLWPAWRQRLPIGD